MVALDRARGHRMSLDARGRGGTASTKCQVYWHAPFFTGGGYCTEATSYVLSLLYQPAFTQEFDLSILQHGGAVDRAYVESLKSSLTRLAPLVLRPGDLQMREERRRDTTPTTIDDVWRTLVGGGPFAHRPWSYDGGWHLQTQRDGPGGSPVTTMFETDRVPIDWLDRLRDLQELWVPTNWSASVFAAAGVPLSRIQVDTTFWDPGRVTDDDIADTRKLVERLRAEQDARKSRQVALPLPLTPRHPPAAAGAAAAGGSAPSLISLSQTVRPSANHTQQSLVDVMSLLVHANGSISRQPPSPVSPFSEDEDTYVEYHAEKETAFGGRGQENGVVREDKGESLVEREEVQTEGEGARVPMSSGSCRKVFLAVGKWEPRKAYDLMIPAFIEAFAFASANTTGNTTAAIRPGDICLVVVANLFGNHPDSEPLRAVDQHYAAYQPLIERKLTAQSSSGDLSAWLPSVVFVNRVSDRQLRALYGTISTALVHTARGEGWGRPLVESLSMQRRVITHFWGGPSAYLTSECAMEVALSGLSQINSGPYKEHRWAEVDRESLKTRLREMLSLSESDVVGYGRMGERGRAVMVERYSLERVGQLLLHYLRRLRQQHDLHVLH
ncbi:unnamed protein product [Vitrella brassicaformis CCMP3155]|uniref:Glycosyl transferase family 1 domain-containing protein n=1 Tax=Vitrella brassicaformis (strain CCMP3155) TaxID=1169540 RepID=A0A0G4FT44_VITBC|nr:unnamed protein product [Vitrella brassicaformis CCMP3155]|eukprot:CEM17653.1 unnamed protein product [Vitrella brassicaformis CCMP3155]